MGKNDKLGAIGYVEGGDTLGEEGIFEGASATRRETTVSEGDSYVFEIIKENFEKLKASILLFLTIGVFCNTFVEWVE